MTNNIKKTKNKLSIMFSVIVFFVVLGLGTLFFSTKYFTEINRERHSVLSITNTIKSGKVPVDEIKRLGKRFEEINLQNRDVLRKKDLKVGSAFLYLNHIHIKNGQYLISSDIKDDIDIELIKEVILVEDYLDLKKESGYLIQKFDLQNDETFIVFKKLKYTFSDYLTDIFGFIIVNILFSILIYIIGTKFVNNAFIPVEENISDMKNFIHNAGHELKTPIAVIDSNLQLLTDMKKYDDEMTEEMRSEIKTLNSLIESLVSLSDIDGFKKIDKNNLNDVLLEIEKDYKSKISDKKINLNIKVPKTIKIDANKGYFYIFLSNLIGNAIKYNIKNGKIDITYKSGILTIKDSGIGIKKDNIRKIFDRFYKVDRSRSSEGIGIGLSLVKKIADIYKWNISVKSEEKIGTEFIVKF